MNVVEKHIIKPGNPLYPILDDLSFKSKNLYNCSLYLVRQQYFENKTFLNYKTLDKMLNSSNQVDYRALPSNTAQQALRSLEKNWKSYFGLIKKKIKGTKIPKYLPKLTGRYIVSFTNIQCRVKNDGLIHFHKLSNIPPLKTKISGKLIAVRIVPITGAYKIEVIYEKSINNLNLDTNNHLSIDLGVNNLMTMTSDSGFNPIIINGGPLKSINQYFNKKLAELKSKLPFQNKSLKSSYYVNKKTKEIIHRQEYSSKKINKLYLDRDNKVDNAMHHYSKYLINLCIKHDIGNIIIGKNDGWKTEVKMGKRNNQNFVSIPYTKLIQKITYKAELQGIKVILQEESYTSKCSALDLEPMEHQENYIGKREYRGYFLHSSGHINADVNGSLNILRKVIGDKSFNRILTNTGIRLNTINKITL